MLAVRFTALYLSGALASVWKHVGMAEVSAFIRAGAGSGAVLPGIRVARRAFFEHSLRSKRAARSGGAARPAVLLVGAGAAGVMAVREIRSRGEQDMDLRGFVDDDPLKQGAVIGGLKVPGPSEALPTLVAGSTR